MPVEQVFNPQTLATLGVGGVIAVIIFLFYRKDVRQYTELWREQAILNRQQTEMLVSVIKENTVALTQNTEVVRSMHRRMDRLDGLGGRGHDEPVVHERRYPHDRS